MKEEDKIQLIEDYINGHLSMQEKTDFQQQLQQDPSLAQEVDLYRNILSGIALSGRKDMKAHLKVLDHTSFIQESASATDLREPLSRNSTQKAIQPFWRNTAWIAGIAASLVVGLFTFLWISNTNSTDNLFTEYYSPYPNVVAAIERGEAIGDEKKLAMQAYENGDYKNAIQSLQQILKTNPEETPLYLYLGVSYIETNQLDSAKVFLSKASSDTTSKLHIQAKWYLALAYLKNKETEQARAQLQSLTLGSGVYAEKASKLLNEL